MSRVPSRWFRLPPHLRAVLIRLASASLAFVVLCTGIFYLLDVVYSPLDQYHPAPDAATAARIERFYRRDESIPARYRDFWRDVGTFDFGTSSQIQQRASHLTVSAARVSAQVVVAATVLGAAIAVVLELLTRSRRRLVGVASALTIAALAGTPVFAATTWLIKFGLDWFDYFPGIGSGSLFHHPVASFRLDWEPVLAMGVSSGGWVALNRFTTERLPAKELGQKLLRAALDSFPFVISGLVVVEPLFVRPGIGRLLYESIMSRDVPVLKASLVLSLLASLAAWVLAPRSTESTHVRVNDRQRSVNLVLLTAASILSVAVVLLGAIGPMLAPGHPSQNLRSVRQGPTLHHLFGTDALGRDIFIRAVSAWQYDLKLVALAVAIGVVPAVGLLMVPHSRRWAPTSERIASIVVALPLFPILLAFGIAFGFRMKSAVVPLALLAFCIAIIVVRIESGEARWQRRLWLAIPSFVQAVAIATALAIIGYESLGFLSLTYAGHPSIGQLTAIGYSDQSITASFLPSLVIVAGTTAALVVAISLRHATPASHDPAES